MTRKKSYCKINEKHDEKRAAIAFLKYISKTEGTIMKRLYKIEEGKKIAGVCGGIAEYLNIDPTVIRLLWVFLVLFVGAGVFAYIIAALVMPNKSDVI